MRLIADEIYPLQTGFFRSVFGMALMLPWFLSAGTREDAARGIARDALIARLVFAQTPEAWTWVGAVVFFGLSVYLTHREARDRRAVDKAENFAPVPVGRRAAQ